TYHYNGQDVNAGNNLLIEQIQKPKTLISFKMAPFVLASTLLTHLFGGSAGREGTAVQMGGSIADQLSRIKKIRPRDRMIILICGVSAGFASVFGTPLAGAIFGLEVSLLGRIRYNALLPSFLAAITANYVCNLWPIKHTYYHVDMIPPLNATSLIFTIIAGAIFGLVGCTFTKSMQYITNAFKSIISYAPLRPFVGGSILAITIWCTGTTKYIGLGILTIESAFHDQLPIYDFAIKLLFTAFTLGAGFKGGEVTPLFFIGATLGNALSMFIPLPMALLAGLGFVAVFSGAANTPIATVFMALELFGTEIGVYASVACIVAYLFSGHTGIYGSQMIGESKHLKYGRSQGLKLDDLKIRKK
ncbi:MAG TPA: chloride channel protein, partial [Cytophagales bacterium]|nr:chloride channel protein [Cytophagales bacterium]